jgi:hypothetical protein
MRRDGSFAEKQQSHPALLFLVPCDSDGRLRGYASVHAEAALVAATTTSSNLTAVRRSVLLYVACERACCDCRDAGAGGCVVGAGKFVRILPSIRAGIVADRVARLHRRDWGPCRLLGAGRPRLAARCPLALAAGELARGEFQPGVDGLGGDVERGGDLAAAGAGGPQPQGRRKRERQLAQKLVVVHSR